MKRITPLLLVFAVGSAQAGQENTFNPLAMMNPMASSGMPFGGYGNPFGGNPFAGNPFAGNPFGGNGFGNGFGNPLLNFNTLSALASLGMIAAPIVAPLAPNLLPSGPIGQMAYPAMQMAPNMMSYGHYGQYGGGPFGGNPYLQRSLPNPMMPPAFSPSMPTMPLSPAQGTLPFAMPSQSAMPSLPFFGAPAQAPAQAMMPSLPFMASPTPMPPAGMIPGLSPMMAPSGPANQGNPWAQGPGQAQPQAQPQPQAGAQSMFNPWMMMMVPMMPQAGSTPAQPAAAPETAATTPLDPAVFMQMFMKPTEAPAAK